MSDLVNRLRQRIEQVLGRDNNVLEYPDELCAEAAARIEALETAIASSRDYAKLQEAAIATLEADVKRQAGLLARQDSDLVNRARERDAAIAAAPLNLDFDTDWFVVKEATNDAYDNGEGRCNEKGLEAAFKAHGLVVAHRGDKTQAIGAEVSK